MIRFDDNLLTGFSHLALLVPHFYSHLLVVLLQCCLLDLYLSIFTLLGSEISGQLLIDGPSLLDFLFKDLDLLLHGDLLLLQLSDLLMLLRLLGPHRLGLLPELLNILLLSIQLFFEGLDAAEGALVGVLEGLVFVVEPRHLGLDLRHLLLLALLLLRKLQLVLQLLDLVLQSRHDRLHVVQRRRGQVRRRHSSFEVAQ